MKIGASFTLEKLQLADLVAAKRIGFDFVEFYIGDYYADVDELNLQLIAIREIIDSYDLFTVIHLAHLNTQIISDVALWTDYVDRISDEIELIGKLGITKKLVFHGVFGHTEDPKDVSLEKLSEAKDAAISEWIKIAKRNNLQMLLENTDESVDDLKPVFKKHKDLGFTFDIGHANIIFPGTAHKTSEEKIYSLLETFKKQLKHIHLHDNFGGYSEQADIHLPIGTASIDFKRFISKLKEMNYTETITLEIYNREFLPIYLEASFLALMEIFSDCGIKP